METIGQNIMKINRSLFSIQTHNVLSDLRSIQDRLNEVEQSLRENLAQNVRDHDEYYVPLTENNIPAVIPMQQGRSSPTAPCTKRRRFQ